MAAHVGFANLPNQIHLQATQEGFEFNLMVVGQSGLGKSTLLNSLFLSDVYVETPYPASGSPIPSTCKVERSTVDMEENGVRLKLTVIDTPGFGDAVNNTGCWQPIVKDIEQAFEQYMDDESRLHRGTVRDSRVHCCLYFIAPSGHRLKPLDIQVMKALQHKVNLVPVIAKADSLTEEECAQFKAKIVADIDREGINVFGFQNDDDDDDDEEPADIPFAVCGSAKTMNVAGTAMRGRQYPWGIIDVDNAQHCDFTRLRDLLLRTHMHGLIDNTHFLLYENYRRDRLAEMGMPTDGSEGEVSESNLMDQLEASKQMHEEKLAKMESDMSQVFSAKVKEKERKFQMQQEKIKLQGQEMKKELERLQSELHNKVKEFEAAKAREAQRQQAAAKLGQAKKKTVGRLF